MRKNKNFTKTSVTQPKELWNKLRNEAINTGKTNDEVLTEILKKHYEAEA